MRRVVFGAILLVLLANPVRIAAQGGDGGLRGTVKDNQGGALPGVTVTASSPALLSPGVAVADEVGNYRLVNLPPGTTRDRRALGVLGVPPRGHPAARRRQFQVDIAMSRRAVGDDHRHRRVADDRSLAPDERAQHRRDFQKAVPLVDRKFWSDFLQ